MKQSVRFKSCRDAAIVLLGCVLGGCSSGGDQKSPESAVRGFITAAQAGDRRAVYDRIGSRTRARVQQLAEVASRGAGRRDFAASDLISAGWAAPAWRPAGVRSVRREGDEAEVEVYSTSGERHTVRLIREAGAWKIDLP